MTKKRPTLEVFPGPSLNVKQVLEEAEREIIFLRRENEVLRAKVETMELMVSILRSSAYVPPQQGCQIDVNWKIRTVLGGLK